METIIQTYQLTKTFKDATIIKPLDFSLRKGEICALIGQNGSGNRHSLKCLQANYVQLQETFTCSEKLEET